MQAENGTVVHEIKGQSYTFKLLPAVAAFSMAQYVIEVAAPVIGSLFDATQDAENIDEFSDNESSFGLDLGLLVSKQLHSVDIQKLAPVLLNDLKKDGITFSIDSLKGSQGLSTLMSLMERSLRENVTDFLAEWLAEKGLKVPSLSQVQSN